MSKALLSSPQTEIQHVLMWSQAGRRPEHPKEVRAAIAAFFGQALKAQVRSEVRIDLLAYAT
ncbi:MAG: hypothetical protein ABI693_18395 [Bryobacteraceae bacterium]